MSALTDGDLVLRCRAGDENAWAELVNRHTRLLHAIARSCGLGAAAADDVVQTTWTRLCTSLDRLREVESVRAWLATTARRESIRTRRREGRCIPFAGSDVDPSAVDEGVLARERVLAVRRAVRRLSEPEQQLIELLFNEPPRSYAEIASTVRRPIGSIGPTRGRLLRRLGGALRTEHGDAA
jgi:RNA polymerase sigma factor (sigma-70 family)